MLGEVRAPPIALALLLLPGCYLSHGLAAGTDGGVAQDSASLACDVSKLRTSGLVEPWAPGSRCELLVACLDTSEAIDAARSAFPDLACRDAIDPSCAGLAPTSCSVVVGTLSDAEHEAACALTLRDDVAALLCAGDL